MRVLRTSISSTVSWEILNYEESPNAELARKFEIQMPVVVLAEMKDGEVQEWERLDEVWALEGDPPAFREFMESEIQAMLDKKATQITGDVEVGGAPVTDDSHEIPVPDDEAPLPIPEERLPVPDESLPTLLP